MTTIVSFFRELYSLDTLDSRFTNAPSIPPRTAKDGQSSATERDRKNVPADISPPRWRTTEFYFYGLVFLFCVPQMYWAVVQVSQRKSSRTHCRGTRGPWDLTCAGSGLSKLLKVSKLALSRLVVWPSSGKREATSVQC